jgi:hypothetical protein
MDESFHIDGPVLERFRRYLSLLTCAHIDSGLRAKIEPSDLVEQTLLEASPIASNFEVTATTNCPVGCGNYC